MSSAAPVIDLVLATQNKGKLKELQALAESAGGSGPALNLILAPAGFDPEETGSTFIENATIKASEAALLTGKLAVADDSGICVDAMDGRPGIYSARYCPGSDADRRIKMLEEMAAVPPGKRQAAFVCAMALVDCVEGASRVLFTCEARWPGELALAEKGSNGFGFDPIFRPAGMELTAAELEPHLKNEISHRAQAWRQVLNFLARDPVRS